MQLGRKKETERVLSKRGEEEGSGKAKVLKDFERFFRKIGRLRKISKERNLEKTGKFWKHLRKQKGSLEMKEGFK